MNFVAVLAFASYASGLISKRQSCCFGLTAKGGPQGKVGQLSDGQNRIGQNLPAASYCIDNGALTDGNGRGCILTPPTTQFQCDTGASPTPGFAVGCDGTVTSNGTSKFYACATGDQGGYNIYTATPAGQAACKEITLTADSCKLNCPASSAPPTSPAPPIPPPSPLPAQNGSCPPNLSGNFEFPHLIIKVDSSQPTKEYGTMYDVVTNSKMSSLLNFDIPQSDADKTCSLVFLFPKSTQLQTSTFTLSGSGDMDFAILEKPARSNTTYSNMPTVKQDYGITKLVPGNSYTIATFPCPAGKTVGFQMASRGDTSFWYFEDYNPAP